MHLTDSCAQLEWMEYLTVGILDGYRTVKDNYMYVRVGHTRYREIVVAVLQMTRGGYPREKEECRQSRVLQPVE